MVLLDTDHLTVLERGGAASLALQLRLAELPAHEIATTIITYEEQMRGWLARLAQAGSTAGVLAAYQRLADHIETFRRVPIAPFDEPASRAFERIQRARIRMGTMDMRIAAIAVAQQAILLTRNLSDFGKVPGLNAQDWTA